METLIQKSTVLQECPLKGSNAQKFLMFTNVARQIASTLHCRGIDFPEWFSDHVLSVMLFYGNMTTAASGEGDTTFTSFLTQELELLYKGAVTYLLDEADRIMRVYDKSRLARIIPSGPDLLTKRQQAYNFTRINLPISNLVSVGNSHIYNVLELIDALKANEPELKKFAQERKFDFRKWAINGVIVIISAILGGIITTLF